MKLQKRKEHQMEENCCPQGWMGERDNGVEISTGVAEYAS
jgi:hypothetical protein